MKCKRCRTQVADDADYCSQCGQDLTSLRQLLKNFYDEPIPPEASGSKNEPEVALYREEDGPSLAPPEPRIILPAERQTRGPQVSLAEALSLDEEEDTRGEEPARGAPPAGFWIRLGAFFLDQLVLGLLLAIFIVVGFWAVRVGAGMEREIPLLKQFRILLPPLCPLILMLGITYFSYFHGAWGQTVGKMIFGLKVTGKDGETLSGSRAFARSLGYFLSAIPFFLGFLWAAFNGEKRAWHDYLAGTTVIREED